MAQDTCLKCCCEHVMTAVYLQQTFFILVIKKGHTVCGLPHLFKCLLSWKISVKAELMGKGLQGRFLFWVLVSPCKMVVCVWLAGVIWRWVTCPLVNDQLEWRYKLWHTSFFLLFLLSTVNLQPLPQRTVEAYPLQYVDALCLHSRSSQYLSLSHCHSGCLSVSVVFLLSLFINQPHSTICFFHSLFFSSLVFVWNMWNAGSSKSSSYQISIKSHLVKRVLHTCSW